HRPMVRIVYNACTYSLAAGAAGALVSLLPGTEAGKLVARVAVCSVTFYAVNVILTSAVVALNSRRPFLSMAQSSIRLTVMPFTLCLVAIADFKQVNDRFGHPSGDRVLSQVASRLRQGGEAFRLGGDEFAVLLPGHDERAALTAATSIVDRIGGLAIDPVGAVTVSA